MKTGHDVIVIGASAGGVQALSHLVSDLPADFPAAVLIVLHLARFGTSAMPAILGRAGVLPTGHPQDGEKLLAGRIYIAPPDHHMLLEDGHIRLSRAPTENGHRPAIDVLFRSAAYAYRNRVVGVVLTGNLDDGTAGLAEIKSCGGIAIVQDPEDADYSGMPSSALAHVEVDHVLALSAIPPLLVNLARTPILAKDEPARAEEVPAGDMKEALEHGADREGGTPSGFTCPDCGGALWESTLNDLVHFRCRTGHAFSPESLLSQQSSLLEHSLWAGVRALLENAALARRMERWMKERGNSAGQGRYSDRAREAEGHAEALCKILVHDTTEPFAAKD